MLPKGLWILSLPSCADHVKVMCLARKHLDQTSAIGGSEASWAESLLSPKLWILTTTVTACYLPGAHLCL
jgi:hypothetical protein